MRIPIEDLVEQIAAGALHIQIGKTFQLDEVVEAHRCMEENKAGGKIVVLKWPPEARTDSARNVLRCLQQVVMIVPVNPDIDEA